MKQFSENRLFYLYLLVFSILSVFGILFIKINYTIDDSSMWLDHTHRVRFQSEQVLIASKDLQLAAKEYVTSTNTSSKINLNKKGRAALDQIRRLKLLTHDNAGHQKRIKALSALIHDRIDSISGDKIELTQESFSNDSAFSQNIRSIIDDIQHDEERLLSERTATNDENRKNLNTLLSVLMLVVALILIVAFFLAKRYINLRRKSLQTIHRLNDELQKLVQEKSHQIDEQEERYQLVLDHMLEGAQIVDYNWRYLYVNGALAKQTQHSAENFVGKTMLEVYPEMEHLQIFEMLKYCMKNRVPKKVENHFTYPNGKSAYYELSIEPVKEGLFILSMDITDRKIKEIYKEQYIAELEEVLFKISHEVRSPVVKILGVAQLLELSLIAKEEFPMVMNAMKDCAVLLDQYTRELSEFITEIKDHSAANTGNGEAITGEDPVAKQTRQ